MMLLIMALVHDFILVFCAKLSPSLLHVFQNVAVMFVMGPVKLSTALLPRN